jgi:tetratricopeptide (TPR) repeat protein
MSNREKTVEKAEQRTEHHVAGKENIVAKIIRLFNQYQNYIYGVLIGVLILAAAYILADRFYFQPKIEKGSVLIRVPITHYLQGVQSNDTTQLQIALEGDDENEGFLDLISAYKLTKVANTAKYFAGMTYLTMGQKEEALDYLLKFKHKEDTYWYLCQMTIGDLYDDEGNISKAISYYQKAAKGNHEFYTPIALFKLGQMYERENNWGKAYQAYNQVKTDYFNQYQSIGIDRFLENAKIKAGK